LTQPTLLDIGVTADAVELFDNALLDQSGKRQGLEKRTHVP